MVPVLHYLTVVDDVDLVHALDGGQSVGDGDGGAANLGRIKCVLDNLESKQLHSTFFMLISVIKMM